MNLIRFTLRHPISIVGIVIALAVGGAGALWEMNYDIFPALDIPTIYVIEAYPGMLPDQMESFLTYWFEQRFTYVGGVKHVESRSLLNCAVMKVEFQQGTDMGVAMGETVAECTRAVANMPAGTRPPLIMRYDAGGVPVGDLVFSSRTASVAELQDMAANIVRPFFATLPGVSAPPPFGGAPRAIVVNLKPDRLAQYNISPEDVVIATANANMVTPAGLVPIWNRYPMVRLNSEIQNIEELLSVPIRTGVYPTVFLRDIATVEDSHDIVTCYALVNGRRTIYLPVTKRASASTLAVVNTVKKNVPMFQKFLPEGINVSYEFDQSPYVTRAINNLAMAGVLGAVLAGLVILIFLRDWFSPFIVMINILLGVMSAALALWLAGQTINIMTLVGLALAVAILVNESTVCIENLHVHLEGGEPLALAALNSTSETLGPRLLSVICSLAMFSPTAFMSGASRSLFFPLSLAAGFSLIASYLLSSALVPVLSIWMLRGHQKFTKNDKPAKNRFETFKKWYTNFVFRVIKLRWWALGGYLAVSAIIIIFVGGSLSTEIYPTVNSGRLQIRLVAPAGTQLDDTEALTLKTIATIKREVGSKNVGATVAFVGLNNPNYTACFVYVVMSGTEQSLLQVQLQPGLPMRVWELQERLRKILPEEMPGVNFSFEPSDIVSQVMSLGVTTPIEIASYGPDIDADVEFAKRIKEKMATIPDLRDIHFGQVLDYPTLDVNFDRERSGIIGANMYNAMKSLVPAVWSSRYTFPLYWGDPHSDCTYELQVQTPQEDIRSIETILNTQVNYGSMENRKASLFRNLANFKRNQAFEEYAHLDNQRLVTVNANLAPGAHLGSVSREVEKMIEQMGAPPPRVAALIRGQAVLLNEMMEGLQKGSIFALFLMLIILCVALQSVRLTLSCLSIVPAAICGIVIALKLTNTAINIQSFSGAVVSIGLVITNSILFVIFAERSRVLGWRTRFISENQAGIKNGASATLTPPEELISDGPSTSTAVGAALAGAGNRLRPVLMTSLAMIFGMAPMALGWGEGGKQTAPLGLALVAGLVMATPAILLLLPPFFAIIQESSHGHSASLDPYHPESSDYISGGSD